MPNGRAFSGTTKYSSLKSHLRGDGMNRARVLEFFGRIWPTEQQRQTEATTQPGLGAVGAEVEVPSVERNDYTTGSVGSWACASLLATGIR